MVISATLLKRDRLCGRGRSSLFDSRMSERLRHYAFPLYLVGIALLAASGVVVVASGIAARWRYYETKTISASTVRATGIGLAGAVVGVLLVALAGRWQRAENRDSRLRQFTNDPRAHAFLTGPVVESSAVPLAMRGLARGAR